MPATDHYWRNLKTMHVVFAVSSLALLAAVVWMMAADHDDEFRDYQRTFYQLEAMKFAEKEAAASGGDYDKQLATAQKELARAEEALSKATIKNGEGEVVTYEELRVQARDLGQEVKNLSGKLKEQKALQGRAASNKGLAVTKGASKEELERLLEIYEAEGEKVQELQVELETLTTELTAIQSLMSEMSAERDEAEKQVKVLETQVATLTDARLKLQPESWLQKTKRALMELPVIDGFNSHLSPKQDWLPDLPIKLGMAETARFDRCRTCHLGIDAVESGGIPKYPFGMVKSDKPEDWMKENQFPHPYATHPNTDLYTTASSPHPVTTFGCTICHEGAGSATTFTNVQHMPNDPIEEEKWKEEYGFFSNHFWEYPMHTKRFVESSCIKCHHEVTELGVNEEWGPTAPKVNKGHELIKSYGCFGCHEIQGYEGDDSIGPDLRLEPPTVAEAYQSARRQIGLLPEADPTQEQWAEITALIPKLTEQDNAHPGEMRKVGPALTHIGTKTTRGWLEHWIRNPKEFRPTTKMPRFYDLSNQHDDMAKRLQPVEVAAITQYLLDRSASRNDTERKVDAPAGLDVGGPLKLMSPADDYEPDAERGESLFAQKGCLACHAHDNEKFAGAEADFGPELSKIHMKLKPGKEGFNWLYTWLNDPNRYHPRTKMPVLYLGPQKVGDDVVDAAADITAYLLKDAPEESAYDVTKVDDKALNELVTLQLSGKSLTQAQTEQLLGTDKKAGTRDYPISRDKLRGDELELTLPGDAVPSEEEWTRLRLNYIGKRTISRYGCYACHSIPGFEDARPIGVALQDWGRKDPTKLALEHIEEYLHGHGMDGHGSTTERIERALKTAASGEFESDEKRKEELDIAWFYDQLIHHGRPGFIWQKLREPRSYDYKKTETKKWDERLRMPKFTFSQDSKEDDAAREAIITFVLGLVAEPPPASYIYQPSKDEQTLITGQQLLTKYNCTGCHVLEFDTQVVALNPEDILSSFKGKTALFADAEAGNSEFHAEALRMLLDEMKPPLNVDQEERKQIEIDGETEDAQIVRFRGLMTSPPEASAPIEDQEVSYVLWSPLETTNPETGEKSVMLPNQTVSYRVLRQQGVEAGQGGAFSKWLVSYLSNELAQANQLPVWQLVPPPLDVEGYKAQTPWLYEFFLEPESIRPMTVLRMPKFNMSKEEARALANYFAARNKQPYPYQDITPRDPAYLSDRVADLEVETKEDYLHDSWKALQAKQCIGCHSIGNRMVAADAKKEAIAVQGPNLELATDRLLPDYTSLWISRPEWILPYTGMKIVYPNGRPTDMPKLFNGDPSVTNTALRDALMNYHRLAQDYPGETYEPEVPGAKDEGDTPEGAAGEEQPMEASADGGSGSSPVEAPSPDDAQPSPDAPMPSEDETVTTPPADS